PVVELGAPNVDLELGCVVGSRRFAGRDRRGGERSENQGGESNRPSHESSISTSLERRKRPPSGEVTTEKSEDVSVPSFDVAWPQDPVVLVGEHDELAFDPMLLKRVE